MDKVRRSMVISAPLVPLVGLTACGGGGDCSEVATAPQAGGRAQAQAVTASNNTGLKVSGTLLYYADSIFRVNNAYITMVPDAALIHGCINNNVLQLTMWMGSGAPEHQHQRAVTMKLPAPALNNVYDVAQMPTGEAALVVTVMQFNSTTGKGSSAHYDYRLKSGKVQVVAMAGTDITLKFTTVKGTPTLTSIVPNNVATRDMQLDGLITVRLAPPQSVAWLA